jgi:NADPH:quinone reductase-like Zn-dependent oxidoreductase
MWRREDPHLSIDRSFPLHNAAAAEAHVRANAHFGRIVLMV